MLDLTNRLQATNGLFKADTIKTIKITNPKVSNDEIIKASKHTEITQKGAKRELLDAETGKKIIAIEPDQTETNNNHLDEIIIQNDNYRAVIYGDELSIKDGKLPKVGDTIKFGDLEGKVIHVDDESNEEWVEPLKAAGTGAAIGAMIGLATGTMIGFFDTMKEAVLNRGSSGITIGITTGTMGGMFGAGGLLIGLCGSKKEDDAQLKALAQK